MSHAQPRRRRGRNALLKTKPQTETVRSNSSEDYASWRQTLELLFSAPWRRWPEWRQAWSKLELVHPGTVAKNQATLPPADSLDSQTQERLCFPPGVCSRPIVLSLRSPRFFWARLFLFSQPCIEGLPSAARQEIRRFDFLRESSNNGRCVQTWGANWNRPDGLKRRWRAVVGQLATLKADYKLNCQFQFGSGRLVK